MNEFEKFIELVTRAIDSELTHGEILNAISKALILEQERHDEITSEYKTLDIKIQMIDALARAVEALSEEINYSQYPAIYRLRKARADLLIEIADIEVTK